MRHYERPVDGEILCSAERPVGQLLLVTRRADKATCPECHAVIMSSVAEMAQRWIVGMGEVVPIVGRAMTGQSDRLRSVGLAMAGATFPDPDDYDYSSIG